MRVEVETPIVIRLDNIGGVVIGGNVKNIQRNKHMDVTYHFVREFVCDGFRKHDWCQNKGEYIRYF